MSNHKQKIAEIVRVDHAGEYGAKRIYAGQMAVIKDKDQLKIIQHMAQQEDRHLEYFEKEIVARQVRPTLLMPVWHVAAYALGAATAMLGPKAAMTCTEAVEEIIEKHYQSQLDILDDKEGALKDKIALFRDEEIEHKNTALANDAAAAPFYGLLKATIKTMTSIAITISKRV